MDETSSHIATKFKNYLLNANLHSLKYIGNDSYHIIFSLYLDIVNGFQCIYYVVIFDLIELERMTQQERLKGFENINHPLNILIIMGPRTIKTADSIRVPMYSLQLTELQVFQSSPESQRVAQFLVVYEEHQHQYRASTLHHPNSLIKALLIYHSRLFWIGIFGGSIYGLTQTLSSVYADYNTVSFLTETTYLDWNTTFPAITVCQISGNDFNLSQEAIGNEDPTSLEFFVMDILFFTGTCYSCQTQCEACSRVNISNVVSKLRKPCHKVLDVCSWNGNDFDCCEKFLPLDTEYGQCFSLNSMHTSQSGIINSEFLMNRVTGPGELTIKSKQDIRVYYHAPEDVPFINSDSNFRKDVLKGEYYEILLNVIFQVIEIENSKQVHSLSVENRECRFPEELPVNFKVHKLYSYSTCMVQCHAENHIRLCNCTHHLMPVYNTERYCDIEGLKCLTDHFEIVNRIHAKGYNKPGLICECLPSCTEPEYTIVSDLKKTYNQTTGITIKLQALPTLRFKRVVVKDIMDLVVSVGGVVGLFFGASLISVVEMIYFMYL
ncbi:pickpocket protein 11-like [Rhynchophorus ferrugineus]|uniref:pickpocket protein 11-like n=1 Tax=Rhynchophorus ferrugineus TaxID=354439 RepID=UPI003FCEA3C3